MVVSSPPSPSLIGGLTVGKEAPQSIRQRPSQGSRPEVCERPLVAPEIKELPGWVMEGVGDMQRPGLALRSLDIKKERKCYFMFISLTSWGYFSINPPLELTVFVFVFLIKNHQSGCDYHWNQISSQAHHWTDGKLGAGIFCVTPTWRASLWLWLSVPCGMKVVHLHPSRAHEFPQPPPLLPARPLPYTQARQFQWAWSKTPNWRKPRTQDWPLRLKSEHQLGPMRKGRLLTPRTRREGSGQQRKVLSKDKEKQSSVDRYPLSFLILCARKELPPELSIRLINDLTLHTHTLVFCFVVRFA